jgi:Cyclin-dependent kinase inhibitor 3 (CDKN3)
MKAIENCTPLRHRCSDALRLVVGSCLMTGLLTLAGCSFLETVRTRTAAPDDRAQLGWQDGTLFLRRGELDDYRCTNGLALQCESVSGRSLCHCPQR